LALALLALAARHLEEPLRVPLLSKSLLAVALLQRALGVAHRLLGVAQLFEHLLGQGPVAALALLAEVLGLLGELLLVLACALQVALRAGRRRAAQFFQGLLGPGQLALERGPRRGRLAPRLLLGEE